MLLSEEKQRIEYMGYCPREKFHVGATYGQTTHELLRHVNEERKRRQQSDPNRSISKEVLPKERPSEIISKRKVVDSDLKFTSSMVPGYTGYTGYVPGERFSFGMSYPLSTKVALQNFNREEQLKVLIAQQEIGTTQINQRRVISLLPDHNSFPLPRERIPRYTGHVPGLKFTFGETYGTSTKKKLGFSNSQDIKT
ncbi:protein FAM166B-like [Limulus polyphemus]|uniref:Protein FAM166B-like n=1 Tax=Limulus polyphemus TaxID=6850 RepID=A0ABM1STS0_LIMPO|nr:protein FAM166B-like [Limulus polyphemus]